MLINREEVIIFMYKNIYDFKFNSEYFQMYAYLRKFKNMKKFPNRFGKK